MTIVNYYSVSMTVEGDDELDRMLALACSMPYHRIYIDNEPDAMWTENCQYQFEVLFINEHDVTLFNLRI